MKRVGIGVAVVATVVAVGSSAFGFWSGAGAGHGNAATGALTAPGQPATTGSGTFQLSWSAATVTGGGTIGYHVERRPQPGSAFTSVCGSTAAAPIAATTCADTPGGGTWVYRVTSRHRSWSKVGAESDAVSVALDTTAPTRTAVEMFDTNANGKVDQVKVTYNEALAATPTGTWSLANIPSGGTLGTPSIAGNQVIIPITESAGGVPNTAVGSFTVALTANAPKDAAGNAVATFTATAPTDKAGPVPVTVTLANANGQAAKDDTATVVFSEALAPASLCPGQTSWTTISGNGVVTHKLTETGTNDVLTVPSVTTCTGSVFNFGSLTTGNYVSADRTFSGNGSNQSQIALTGAGTTVVVTLGTASGTTNTGVAAAAPTYTPNSAIKDAAGNAAVSYSGTYASGRF